MRDAEVQAWIETLTIDELKGQVFGLIKSDSKQKMKIHKQERSLLGLVDKNGRLRYELERLEDTLVDCFKHPQHTKLIVQRTIPKRIYKETL